MEHEALTAEQAHYEALEQFTIDVRNIRFVENHANWRLMMDFLTAHNLEVTPPNLRFAYLALSKDGLLDLLPLGHLAPTQPEPTPTPTVEPPPVIARARTFVAFRNGQPITGNVRSL
jgi:hypothetical protein